MRVTRPVGPAGVRFLRAIRDLVVIVLLSLPLARLAAAAPVTADEARAVATAWLGAVKTTIATPAWQEELRADGRVVAWVCGLEPTGYVVVAADTDLPPVVAYSREAACPREGLAQAPLGRLVAADLASRLAARDRLDPAVAAVQDAEWRDLLAGAPPVRAQRFEQWPPAGTTPTGGWLTGSWTQNAPYNAMCPLDLAHGGTRSLAGCPSVAMAMILDYRRTIEGTKLDDTDRYWHGYAGNYYWVPDAAAQYGFPDFETLRGHLETITLHWDAGAALTNTDKAALVFACGVAARQVYSASGSGTFGVNQAYEAYVRFGFGYACRLLTDAAPDLYTVLAANMKQARPAHLAVVDPGWTMGHNLVVDGWNTDDYYHLNFGWGGSYNGWYRLPQGMPYGLTVIEGVIVNIVPAVADVADDGAPATRVATLACAPNPFNPRTTFRCDLPRSGRARLVVYDVAGRRVRGLLDGDLPAGPREVAWDGRDDAGRAVAAGSYLARLEGDGTVAVTRVVLVR
jgi:hypothetical protein